MARLLEYVWRRHLQAATRRAMLLRTRGVDEGIRPVMAVGFADMVGFTVLSQHLGDEELAAVVARFEELAHDTVVALGGRVVKMIGDEVMFVVQTRHWRRPDRPEPGRGLRRRRPAVRRAGGARHRPGAGQGRRLLRAGGQPGQPAGQRGPTRAPC